MNTAWYKITSPLALKSARMPCPRCDDLDLDKLFANEMIPCRPYGFPVAEIHELSRICRRARCSVCRFLASSTSLMDTCLIADTWHLRAFDIDTIVSERIRSEMIALQKLVLVLVPGPANEELEFDVGESDLIIATTRFSKSDVAVCETAPVGRMLNRQQISWDLIRTWLDMCIQNHGQRCTSKPNRTQSRSMPPIRVIDCEDGNVVPFDGSKFVALSYCIGPQNRKRKRGFRLGKETKQRKKVVMDAMECTKKLGYRYLWVDQVCIDQDDKAAVQDTISKMDLIYSQAIFTIVSLAPTQDDGLPGVSNVLRQEQSSLHTERTTYVSTMRSLAVAIHKSKWISRAWCYQEAQLSKRLLIFSPQQVFFVCDSSHLSEALNSSTQSPSPALIGLRQLEYASQPDSADGSSVLDEIPWSFGAWIAAFTTRDITFQNDVLNAFRGILNICEYQSLWGVPFIVDSRSSQNEVSHSKMAEAFARGLSWSTSYNSDQFAEMRQAPTTSDFYYRSDFPSWSWASCRTYHSPIRYQLPGGFAAEYFSHIETSKASSSLKIEVESSPGSVIPVVEFCFAQNRPRILPEKSRHIYITAETVKLRLCQVHINFGDDKNPHLAKFCISIPTTRGIDADESITVESSVFEDTPNELEDGRFITDFDKPPTAQSNRPDDLRHKELLGLILLRRIHEDEIDGDGGEYCVMIVEPLSDASFWVRVGMVWITPDHMKLFPKQQKRVRLG